MLSLGNHQTANTGFNLLLSSCEPDSLRDWSFQRISCVRFFDNLLLRPQLDSDEYQAEKADSFQELQTEVENFPAG